MTNTLISYQNKVFFLSFSFFFQESLSPCYAVSSSHVDTSTWRITSYFKIFHCK